MADLIYNNKPLVVFSDIKQAQDACDKMNAQESKLNVETAWLYTVEPWIGGYAIIAFDETGYRLGAV